MRKLNVAIICDAINNFVAGSFVSALRFAELLSKKGHKIVIISSKYPTTPEFDNHKGIRVYRLSSFPIPKSNKSLYFAYPNLDRIKNILKEEKIEIVHFMVPTPLSYSAIKAAKNLNLKIIAHSHTQPENWATYFPKLFDKLGITYRIINIVYKYVIRTYEKADAVICPSKFSQNILESKGLKKKTYVISNGVDTSKFKKQNSLKYCKDYGLSLDTRKLLFVGRLDPEKNISLFIKSAKYIEKSFEKFEICIVGSGSMREKLENLSKKLSVDKKVKFLGRVSDEDLVRIYNFCDIFILPSLVELEGMVVLEAMSCGKPLLIADAPESASRFFVKNNGLLFNPNEVKDLARKALKLLKNEKLREKMAKQSYKNSKDFDINNSISKLEKAYYSVIDFY